MNLWRAFKNALSTLRDPQGWLVDAFSSPTSSAGVTVNDKTAIQLSAVYACVDRLSAGVASLPLITYERKADGGRERATSFYLYEILHNSPNQWQTAFEFWQWVMVCAVYKGNAFAFIDRDTAGRVRQLIPIHPEDIEILVPENGTLDNIAYRYKNNTPDAATFLQNEIFHVKGMPTRSPLIGQSVISAQRDTLGGALAAEQQSNKLYASGTVLTGIIKVPVKIDSEQRDLISEEWDKRYGGSSNAHKVAVLGADADFKPISMNAEEAQLVETRKLSRAIIAGIFNVPPHMIGDNEHATFSNIEHQDLSFAKHTLRSWLTRIEQAVYRDLLTEREKTRYYVEFLIDALLRGDFKTRQEGMRIKIESGQLTPNEARRLDNMNPYDGGDIYLTPLNMRITGPDAPDLEPDNINAKKALITESATRLIERSISAVTRAAKKEDVNETILAAGNAAELFKKVMATTIAATYPGANINILADAYQDSLIDTVSNANNLTAELAHWKAQMITDLESIPHA